MKTYRYKLNLVIESDTDQEEWIRENVNDLIENPDDDFLSLKSYELKKEMFYILNKESTQDDIVSFENEFKLSQN